MLAKKKKSHNMRLKKIPQYDVKKKIPQYEVKKKSNHMRLNGEKPN